MKNFLTPILLLIAVFTFVNPNTDEKIDDSAIAFDADHSLQDLGNSTEINSDNGYTEGFDITSNRSEGHYFGGTAIGHGEIVGVDPRHILAAHYTDIRVSDIDLKSEREQDRCPMRMRGTEGSGETLQGDNRVLPKQGNADAYRKYTDTAGSPRIFETVPMAWIPSEHRPVGIRWDKNL